jgi:hypothetical protein
MPHPPEDDPILPGPHVDHVIAIKHGGPDQLENLACACYRCNGCKGTDLATLKSDGKLVRLFDPRRQVWHEHFSLRKDCLIVGITEIGVATARLLAMNDVARVTLRLEYRVEGLLAVPHPDN